VLDKRIAELEEQTKVCSCVLSASPFLVIPFHFTGIVSSLVSCEC